MPPPVLSTSAKPAAVGQAAGGPVLPATGTAWGIPAAIFSGAALLAPALALYGRALKHDGREPELAELPEAVTT